MATIKMSEIRAQYPAYDDLSDDQLLIGLHKAKFPQMKANDFFSQVDRDTERTKLMGEISDETYQPDSMLPTKRWAAQNSAGYENLVQGVQQLAAKVGLGKGPTDADIEEKRTRDSYLKRNLGDAATMAMGETMPLAGVPVTEALAAAAPVARMLPQATRAVQSMGPAARVLTNTAGMGALGAELAPTKSDESKNIPMGAAAGMAIPLGGAGVVGAVQGGMKLFTRSGAGQRALEHIARTLPQATSNIDALDMRAARMPQATRGGQPVDLPVTAAQATGDPYLAQLEGGSRGNPQAGPRWNIWDKGQNEARYQHLQDLTPSELRVERLERLREGRAEPMRQQAMEAASPAVGPQRPLGAPVVQHVNDLLAGPQGSRPGVTRMANYVLGELGDNASHQITPERMHVVRQELARMLDKPAAMTDELAASVKASRRETMQVINQIDASLDTASGGRWSPYLQEYTARSRPINSANAMQDLTEKLGEKPLLGDAPEMKYAGVSSAARRATTSKFGDKLTPQARGDLDAYIEHLRSAESASRLRKNSATDGGGSMTSPNSLWAQKSKAILKRIPGVGGYTDRIGNYNRELVEEGTAHYLQNQNELRDALRRSAELRRMQRPETADAEWLANYFRN